MGRKPISDSKIDQIVLMTATGSKTSQIAKELGLTVPTVSNYQKKYALAIKGKREELDIPEEPETNKGGFTAVDTDKTNTEKPKEKPDPIEAGTHQKFMTKGSEYLSKKLEQQLKDAMDGAKMLIDAQLKYQKSLEEMGVTWDKFIDFSFKLGYDAVEERYLKELESRARDRSLNIQVEQKLHDEEIQDMTDDEENPVRRLLSME